MIAILIPTTSDRKPLLDRLLKELYEQIGNSEVLIITNHDNKEKTTGTKRNELIQKAIEKKADYIAFHDDDDLPGPTYIQRGLEVAASGLDCGELWGQIYWNGKKGLPFHHSIIHKEWWQDDKFYYRTINHLNFIKLDLVKDVKFPDQNFGEDGQWSMKVQELGLLKTMYPIPEVIYHYFNGNPKHAI